MQYGATNWAPGTDVAAMAAACLRTSDCAAFSDNAAMYHSVPQNLAPYVYRGYLSYGRCAGLYVRSSTTLGGELARVGELHTHGQRSVCVCAPSSKQVNVDVAPATHNVG